MSEHYSKQTVSVSAPCFKCMKPTEHRVDSGRLGPCMRCIERLQSEHAYHEQERRSQQRQGVLFRQVL